MSELNVNNEDVDELVCELKNDLSEYIDNSYSRIIVIPLVNGMNFGKAASFLASAWAIGFTIYCILINFYFNNVFLTISFILKEIVTRSIVIYFIANYIIWGSKHVKENFKLKYVNKGKFAKKIIYISSAIMTGIIGSMLWNDYLFAFSKLNNIIPF